MNWTGSLHAFVFVNCLTLLWFNVIDSSFQADLVSAKRLPCFQITSQEFFWLNLTQRCKTWYVLFSNSMAAEAIATIFSCSLLTSTPFPCPLSVLLILTLFYSFSPLPCCTLVLPL